MPPTAQLSAPRVGGRSAHRATAGGTGAIRSGARRRAAPLALVSFLGSAWLCLVVLPVDFVHLNPPWMAVNAVATALGLVLAIWAVLSYGVLAQQRLLIVLLFALLAGPVVQGQVSAAVLSVAACAFIGYTFGALSGRAHPAFVVSLLMGMTALLLVEALLTRHVYSEALGVPYRQALSGVGFRARGALGQPVPASMAAVTALVLVWSTADRSRRPRRVRLLAVALTAICLLITGTRSALVVLALVVLLTAAARLKQRQRTGVDPKVVLAWLTTGVAGLLAVVSFVDELRRTRLLSFSSLDGSVSLTNRLNGGETLQRMQGDPIAHIVLGRGLRSLQEDLIRYNAIGDVTTVDNQLITSMWDSGLLALGILAVLLLHAVRACVVDGLRSTRGAVSAAACAALLSCLFFDALYVRSMLMIVTAVLGLWAAQSTAQEAGSTGAQP